MKNEEIVDSGYDNYSPYICMLPKFISNASIVLKLRCWIGEKVDRWSGGALKFYDMRGERKDFSKRRGKKYLGPSEQERSVCKYRNKKLVFSRENGTF